jgi:2-C-methyl-D-erythritol 4-phosphate cytidylyltransferase
VLDEDDEGPVPVGIVPVEGRGSMPFALLHGESLVAVASWALGEAGVRLLDFTTTWDQVLHSAGALVIHDPLCPGTPVTFIAEAVRLSAERGTIVVGARPVTDTVRTADAEGALGATVDRSGLLGVTSPVVLPAAVLAALPVLPSVDDLPGLGDLADLVSTLREHHDVVFLDAPPQARRVEDASDLRLLEAF